MADTSQRDVNGVDRDPNEVMFGRPPHATPGHAGASPTWRDQFLPDAEIRRRDLELMT
jgi:hypothetical protein